MSGLARANPSPRPTLTRSKRFDPKDLLSLGSDSKKPVNKFQEPKQSKITQFLRKSMKGAHDVNELRASDKTCIKKESVIPDNFSFSGSKQGLAVEPKLKAQGKSIAIFVVIS